MRRKHATFTLRSACIATLMAVTLSACGDRDADRSTADAPAPPPSAGPAMSTVAVTDVRLGKSVDMNRRVTDDTDDFAPGDTIYASVVTTGSSPNARLHARWTFEDGQLVDSTTQPVAPTGDAATEFHISNPGGLPKGSYRLTVLLDGAEVRTKDFKVE